MPRPFTVLFDACLWNETVTHDHYMVTREVEWGGTTNHISIAELQPKRLRGKSHTESHEIFEDMRRIAEPQPGQRLAGNQSHHNREWLCCYRDGRNLRRPHWISPALYHRHHGCQRFLHGLGPRTAAPLRSHGRVRRGSEQPQARSCDALRY